MKNQNRSRRKQSNSRRQKRLDGQSGGTRHRRRTWTFEQLEERCFLSVTPIGGLENLEWTTISNSTPEGQQLITALEQLWAAQATTPTNLTGTIDATTRAAPTDPYFEHQWHLFNVGQIVNPGQFQDLFGRPGEDINVIPVWDSGITGEGVLVAVVDTGVELTHPDLVDNIDAALSFNALNAFGGGDGAPTGITQGDGHGTAVAGLIGAVADNGIGVVGVAFGSTLVPIKFLPISPLDPASTSDTFIRAVLAEGAPIDIFNHSWGPSDALRAVDGPDMNALIALTNSAIGGRGGLGSIHVWAAGNGAENYDSAGSDGYVNSRYTIAVGIVDHDGTFANSDNTSTRYGEMAPSVLIVAPSASGPTDIINNFATGSGVTTTDLTEGGLNVPPLPNGTDLDIDTFPDADYTTRMGGTSAATPIVSGVIALMLEANPNLSYRDVQEILVRSSRQNDDLDPSWVTNLIPLFRDPFQGFGFYAEGGVYPNDGDPWNDQIVYRLVPGTMVDPAVQATTGAVPATNSDFTVTARPDLEWDGWVGNNLAVVFRTMPAAFPNAVADVVEGTIRVTVSGDSVTWGDIEAAIELLGQDFFLDPVFAWFEVTVSVPDGLFDPFDERIFAPLVGGLDETGVEMELERARQYEFYHPIADPITNPEPVSLFTNGAGYTVSHGRHRDDATEYGYAHGVVNAALAVDLARDWHLKDQDLRPEKTWLEGQVGALAIRAAEISNEDSGEYVIPGGLVTIGAPGFIDYFHEFFTEPTIIGGDQDADPPTVDVIDPDSLPFSGDDPIFNGRGFPLFFDIPAIDPVAGGSNLMSMEWVEVKLNITGPADAMNYLRITLVSPDGTHSELTQNHFMQSHLRNNFQSRPVDLFVTPPDSITPVDMNGGQSDTFNWVYSTNRIWGERSDSKPVFDEYGNPVFDSFGFFGGLKSWELHFENFSETELRLDGMEIAFHGNPIGSAAEPVERIMGKVGVDSGRFIQTLDQIIGANDSDFNFDRSFTDLSPNSLAPSGLFFGFSITPFGEHEIRFADRTQERFAENITVYAIDNNTDLRVAEFITGYDGNYYFDLPANLIQATTGSVAAENTTFNVSATSEGFFSGAAGDNISVEFHLDPTADGVDVVYDFFDQSIDVFVKDESVEWGDIESAIEDLFGGGHFSVAIGDRAATFAAADQDIVATLTGSADGGYTIGIEDPLGRTALADGRNYDSEWVVVIDTSDPFTRTAGEIDPISGKLRLFDNLNFLLDPGSIPADEVLFTGQVIGDLNGNGIQDPEDVGVFNFVVFADLNHTGQFEVGEPFTVTNEDGTYELAVPTATPNTFSIGVDPPLGWTTTFPASGLFHEYAFPGDQVDDTNFLVEPPSTPSGVGNGTIFGLVFNDVNGDGEQQSFEFGMPNTTVFIDADLNGKLGPDEIYTVTNDEGAYQFGEVELGTLRIEAVVEEPFVLTAPATGYHEFTLVAGEVSTENDFGVRNLAIDDFGDLVGDGFLTYGPDAARHFVVPGFSLGATIDAEIRPRSLMETAPNSGVYVPDPTMHGTGDDQEISTASFDDEEGVVVVGGMLRPGVNTLAVTLNGVGGYLQGWIDFNNNLAFEASEQVFVNEDLNPGTHQRSVVAPITLAEGQVAARFRWGTKDMDYFGADTIGEVEDYLLDTDLSQIVFPVGDFNHDLVVDQADYDLWKATFGSTVDLRADANENGVVDAADYSLWRDHLGESFLGSGSGALAGADGGELEPANATQSALPSSYELSYAAWQERISQASNVSPEYIAWVEAIGGQVVTVDGPNGPTLRFAYTLPDSTVASSTSSLTGLPTGGGASASPTDDAVYQLAANDGQAPIESQQQAAVASRGLAAFPFSTTVSLQLTASPVRHSLAADTDADSNLLLLDQVLSEMAPTREDDQEIDALAVPSSGENEKGELQLALAAVFDEEIDWRFGS